MNRTIRAIRYILSTAALIGLMGMGAFAAEPDAITSHVSVELTSYWDADVSSDRGWLPEESVLQSVADFDSSITPQCGRVGCPTVCAEHVDGHWDDGCMYGCELGCQLIGNPAGRIACMAGCGALCWVSPYCARWEEAEWCADDCNHV